MHKPLWKSLNLSPDTSLGRNSKSPYTGSLSRMACLSLPGHAIYQSVPDYECGCETNGDGQSHFDINFSPAIWQGDSDILISFEGCNLFREKKFLVWWNLRGEKIPSYIKCNISITLIQLWNKAKVINCNLRFRAVFDWISKNQNQSNTKADPKKRKCHQEPMRARSRTKEAGKRGRPITERAKVKLM